MRQETSSNVILSTPTLRGCGKIMTDVTRLHRNTMISHDALIVHLRHRKITEQEAENKHTKVVGAEL
jgi:hypothetical protein